VARSKRSVSVGLFVVCLALALLVVARRPAQMPGRLSVIVDTDAGTDDLIAIAFLLARPDVDILAIMSVNGIAHAEAGARNVLRLLRAANRRVDVYVGADQPLDGRDAFPAEWRQQADDMTALPAATGRRTPRPDAVSGLLVRLRNTQGPITVVALGPLTNIATALQREPRTVARIAQLVIMGGAIDVPGNAPANAAAPVAEWNMYVDPTAASLVFRAGLPITLVPLDATNHVPIDRAFVTSFTAHDRPPLGIVVGNLLASQQAMIDAHAYYAWDPLAAAAIVDPEVLHTREQEVQIVRAGDERGRTRVADGEPNALVAYSASPILFRRLFLSALTRDLR
jgi:inosine-uridine nucleoside N-ribohydrolase